MDDEMTEPIRSTYEYRTARDIDSMNILGAMGYRTLRGDTLPVIMERVTTPAQAVALRQTQEARERREDEARARAMRHGDQLGDLPAKFANPLRRAKLYCVEDIRAEYERNGLAEVRMLGARGRAAIAAWLDGREGATDDR